VRRESRTPHSRNSRTLAMIVLSMIFPGSIDSRTLGKRVAERLLVFLLVFGLVPKLAEREGMTDASFF
jgi:hypothetical protein